MSLMTLEESWLTDDRLLIPANRSRIAAITHPFAPNAICCPLRMSLCPFPTGRPPPSLSTWPTRDLVLCAPSFACGSRDRKWLVIGGVDQSWWRPPGFDICSCLGRGSLAWLIYHFMALLVCIYLFLWKKAYWRVCASWKVSAAYIPPWNQLRRQLLHNVWWQNWYRQRSRFVTGVGRNDPTGCTDPQML